MDKYDELPVSEHGVVMYYFGSFNHFIGTASYGNRKTSP